MGDFIVGTIISVCASTVVGNVHDCLAAGMVFVEGGTNGNMQEIHLVGYGGLVGLDTFAQVLKEIVEDKEFVHAQTWLRWSWEGKAHTGSRGFCIGR
jgi:hypothetical protein